MNVNKVLSNRAIQLLGGEIGSKSAGAPQRRRKHGPVVERYVSAAMPTAACWRFERAAAAARGGALRLRSKRRRMRGATSSGSAGRISRMPCRLPSDRSGQAGRPGPTMRYGASALPRRGSTSWRPGGTAVGTGLNARPHFGREIAAKIAELTGVPVRDRAQRVRRPRIAGRDGRRAWGRCAGSLSADEDRERHALARLGTALRPGRTDPPENEPGSSIMPGKVNPTQSEAMVMVCIQVIADDSAVAFAGSQGNFELNAMRPIVINAFLHLPARSATRATRLRLSGRGDGLDRARIGEMVGRSLMLVTALTRKSGTIKRRPSRTWRTMKDQPSRGRAQVGVHRRGAVRPDRRSRKDGRVSTGAGGS